MNSARILDGLLPVLASTCPAQTRTESFTYDDDGNLTQVCGTGVSPVNYTWDAENRLTCAQSGDPNSPVSGDRKVEFVYDFLGRRVEKKVSTHNGTSWSVSDCRRFVWSDWLPVLELDSSDPNDVTILRKYTWGLDLSAQSWGIGLRPVN